MADLMKVHTEIIENPQGVDQENQRGDTIEKDIAQEEDQEKGEKATARDTENPLTQDPGLAVDTVGTTPDHQVDTDLKLIDQIPTEMKEMEETRDTTHKKIEEVSMAMVAGAEKIARRP